MLPPEISLISTDLLLMENGRLSPGGGRVSPPLLRAEVEKALMGAATRRESAGNIVLVKDFSVKF